MLVLLCEIKNMWNTIVIWNSIKVCLEIHETTQSGVLCIDFNIRSNEKKIIVNIVRPSQDVDEISNGYL